MNNMTLAGICLSLVCLCGCQKELVEYKQGDVKVYIEQGEEWLHDFPLFMGIKKRNPPQIAIWAESAEGKYLSTIYVSHKIVTQSWQAASAGYGD